MKDLEYSYEYDSAGDQKYCYRNSNVLKNKLNIEDAETLHSVERELTMARYFAMETMGVTGDFSFRHLCSIHKYLFQDIYEWAGRVRTVDIAKGTIFCLTQHIEMQFDYIYKQLVQENCLKEIEDKKLFAERIAYYLSEINMIHPFREGNGRTQRMYIEQLCKNNGKFEVRFSNASKEEMLEASKESAVCKYEKMNALIQKCLF